MLVVIVLVVVSLFFPPAWLVLLAYIAYLVVTKKARRNGIIMHEIRKSIAQGRGETIIKALYYQAAKSFAAEHGASMSPYKNDPEDDCLIVDLTVDGSEYNICFQRWDEGGTLLTVSPQ